MTERNKDVRVRFAPSPTGSLHVGNVKTAMVNWLFARHEGGKFILRIEDTDRDRSTSDSVDVIVNALRWMGLDWDEGPDVGGPFGPYFQMRRTDRHREAAEKLVAEGNAYYCYCTPEELEAERKAAKKTKKKTYKYSGKCRELSADEVEARKDEPRTVRFKTPFGKTTFTDFVYGETTVDNREIGDFVIVKSDGTPTYHLAVVVDDVDMEISHIIRGEGHMSNTPKHVLLFDALGCARPMFVHHPMLLGPDRSKLSKRHGATGVMQFKEEGYLPEALFNFLALIGWSTGEDADDEIYTVDELVKLFDLDKIGRTAAIFNPKKLKWMNGQHIRKLSVDELVERMTPFMQTGGLVPDPVPDDQMPRMHRLAEACHIKLATLADVVPYTDFLFHPIESYDEKGVKKHWRAEGAVELLEEFKARLENVKPFAEEEIEKITAEMAESRSVGLGKIIHPVRLAVSGKTVGPGFFDIFELMGREKSLERLEDAIDYVRNMTENLE